MNMLKILLYGITDSRFLDDEPGSGGGSGSVDTNNQAVGVPETTAPSEGGSTEVNEQGSEGAVDDLSSVMLGNGVKNENSETKEVTSGQAEVKKDDQSAEEIKVEDYASGIKLEDGIAADVEIDPEAIGVVAPILKEAGITVEAAGKLVNALAKYQVEKYKNRNKERFEDNKKNHDAAIQKYSKGDFEQINAGIDSSFKQDGVMNYIIRNSEIGNDPEFLALMLWVGQHRPTNTSPMVAGGVGGTTGQPAGFSGISSAWK